MMNYEYRIWDFVNDEFEELLT